MGGRGPQRGLPAVELFQSSAQAWDGTHLEFLTRMPPLHHQVRIPEAHTADFEVARALLRPGRSFEQAVRQFEPYAEVSDENPKAREGLREIIRNARRKSIPAYLFVNNRLEGSAPYTIAHVVEGLD